jgi:hypothetical protein
MDRWKQSMHEFIVIAWLPEYSSWSISWHSAVRNAIQREYNVKISEAILKIEDWMTWRSETLDDCWLPNSWSLALLESWSKASNVGHRKHGDPAVQIESGVQREPVYEPALYA